MLRSRIPDIARKLPSTVDDAIDREAELIVDDARLRLNSITGRLARSLEIKRDDKLGVFRIVAAAIAPESSPEGRKYYGHFVEYGTGHASPHPFLTPAFEEHRQPLIHRTAIAIRHLVETGR